MWRAGVMAVLPVSVGNCVRSGIMGSVRVSCVSVTGVSMSGVTVRISMTVSMATQSTNRHPGEANAAKRECGEIYVH